MKSKPLIERFLERIDYSGAAAGSACWEWAGSRTKAGYGNLGSGRRGGPNVYAHRVSYEHFNGPVPQGFCVLHRCDHPGCVRPEHLFVGTALDNHLDCAAKRRHRPPPRRNGTENHNTKLTDADIAYILANYRRRARGTPFSGPGLARKFGVSMGRVLDIVRKGGR